MSSDWSRILESARGVHEQLSSLQSQLAQRSVEAQAGGGMVTAVATGTLRITRVEIDPALLAEGDRGMIQDLIKAAVNTALERAQSLAQEEMQRMASSLPLARPGGGGGGAPRTGGGTE